MQVIKWAHVNRKEWQVRDRRSDRLVQSMVSSDT